MQAKSGMQQSIIAGILLLRVSRKSFAREPSSPIFSFNCFSSQIANGDFFWPGGPKEKWMFSLASGVGVAMTGGIGGIGGIGMMPESVDGVGATGPGTSGATMSGIFG